MVVANASGFEDSLRGETAAGLTGLEDEAGAAGLASGQAVRDGAAEGMDGLEDDMAAQGALAGGAMREGVASETDKLGEDLAGSGALGGMGLSKGLKDGTEDLEDDLGRKGERGGVKFGESLTKAVEGKTEEFSGMLQSFGVPASLLSGWGLAAVAAGAVGFAAIDMGEKMQSADAAIATSSGISVKAATAIGNAFLNTAGTSEFSGHEMAEAFATVAGQLKSTEGAALDSHSALTFMTAAQNLATAKQIDLGTATQTLAGVMQAFHTPVAQASQVTDDLFNASAATGQGVDTLGAALEKVRSKMGAFAPPVGQLSSLLVDMTNHGETGRAAMTALGSAFTGLVTPVGTLTTAQQETQAEQKKFGLSFETSGGQLKSMGAIISEVQPVIARMGDAQAVATLTALGFGSASSKLLGVIRAGAGAYDQAAAATTKSGSAAAAAAVQSQTLGVEFKTFKATLDDWGTKLGQVLVPLLAKFFEGLNRIMVAAGQLGPVISAAFTIIGDIAGPVLSHIVDVIDDAIEVLAGLSTFLDGIFTGNWSKAWSGIKEIFDGELKGIIALWTTGLDIILNLFGTSMSQLSGKVTQGLSQIVSFFRALPGQIIGVLGNLTTTIFQSLINAPAWLYGNVISPVLSYFAGLPGKIVAALMALPGEMITVGEQIVSGLLAGIEAEAGSVLSAVGSLAHKIEHAITDPLSILSPSRVMMEIGRDIVRGLAIGITDETPSAFMAAYNAAGKVIDALEHAAAKPGLSSAAKKAIDDHVKALAKERADAMKAEISRIKNATSAAAANTQWQVQAISDASAVAVDQANMKGLSGTALTSAQAQLKLDQDTQSGDLAVHNAQNLVNADANSSPIVKAIAAQKLQQAQDALAIKQAVDKATLAIDQQKAQAGASGESASGVTLHINGTGLTGAQLMTEISWALTTGAIPAAA